MVFCLHCSRHLNSNWFLVKRREKEKRKQTTTKQKNKPKQKKTHHLDCSGNYRLFLKQINKLTNIHAKICPLAVFQRPQCGFPNCDPRSIYCQDPDPDCSTCGWDSCPWQDLQTSSRAFLHSVVQMEPSVVHVMCLTDIVLFSFFFQCFYVLLHIA